MNNVVTLACALAFPFITEVSFAQAIDNFHLKPGLSASANIVDGELVINLRGRETLIQRFPLELPENAHLRAVRVNRDAFSDLEVWYPDEGMGTYTIHHLFLFSAKANRFLSLEPRCGAEQFMNLRIVRPGTITYSVYRVQEHVWASCTHGT